MWLVLWLGFRPCLYLFAVHDSCRLVFHSSGYEQKWDISAYLTTAREKQRSWGQKRLWRANSVWVTLTALAKPWGIIAVLFVGVGIPAGFGEFVYILRNVRRSQTTLMMDVYCGTNSFLNRDWPLASAVAIHLCWNSSCGPGPYIMPVYANGPNKEQCNERSISLGFISLNVCRFCASFCCSLSPAPIVGFGCIVQF